MTINVEAIFTAALGLMPPWKVASVELSQQSRRIDFKLICDATRMSCPLCHAVDQSIHDRQKRQWRHLDFFQYEAWLHAEVPRVKCGTCGKTTQVTLPWAREDSGFTLLFEALALSLCQSMPVRQAAQLLRCNDKQLWRRIEHYVGAARKLDDMSEVKEIGIDETSLRKGHHYITVVHDLQKKRLLFACEGKDHKTVLDFAADFQEHGGKPEQIAHVCQDMSTAFVKGVTQALPNAQISFDRFHVVAMANEVMDAVRREEMRTQPEWVKEALGDNNRKLLKSLAWGMRRNPADWSKNQLNAMHWLQQSNLKSARAWRLKMALRTVYANASQHNDPAKAQAELVAWLSWAMRCRLEPFKKLATTLKQRIDGVVRGMLDNRSNAYVEAMNGLLQQAKRAARGFKTATNFIAIAYLRMGKLAHLPANPIQPAIKPEYKVLVHKCL
jgi:transposase